MSIDSPDASSPKPLFLVAFDGSSKDEPALKWALRAARAFGAKLEVIHALGLTESAQHSTGDGETKRAHAEQECRQALQAVIDASAPAPSSKVTSSPDHSEQVRLTIEPGHPALLLLREIERTKPDLVVLGRTPAHSGTTTLGSVSREIASQSCVPVVVVPSG